MNINVVLLYTFCLSPIPASVCPSIPFKCSHTTHDWILTHFSLLNCSLTISTVISASLSSTLIYLNHPPGENRSAPQSGTNCFVRFTNPEPNPDKRTLVRTAVLFVYARVTDCGVIKVFIVPLCCNCGCGGSLAAHQSCHKYGAGAKWQEMLWAQIK